MTTLAERTHSREAEDLIASLHPFVEECRRNLLNDLSRAPERDALIKYFRGGKMLRARLVFTAASAVGGNPKNVCRAAEAIELLHGASLVHDDIIDGSTLRRSVQALHVQLGNGAALALGDFLLLHAFVVLAQPGSVEELNRAGHAIRILSACGQECCRGQIEELDSACVNSEERYMTMVRQKTGSLFAAATMMGASLCDGTSAEIESLRKFGLRFGISYQIYDDMVELADPHWSAQESRMMARDRPFLPLIYLAEHGTSGSAAECRALIESGTPFAHREVLRILKRAGILDLIMTAQGAQIEDAVRALESLRSPQHIRALSLLIRSYRWEPTN